MSMNKYAFMAKEIKLNKAKEKYNIITHLMKSLRIVILWSLIVALISSFFEFILPASQATDIIMFFVILLVDIMMLYALFVNLKVFDMSKLEKRKHKTALLVRTLYSFIGLAFGFLTSVLIIAGHTVIILAGAFHALAHKTLYGPYEAVVLIIAILNITAYTYISVKEGMRYVY